MSPGIINGLVSQPLRTRKKLKHATFNSTTIRIPLGATTFVTKNAGAASITTTNLVQLPPAKSYAAGQTLTISDSGSNLVNGLGYFQITPRSGESISGGIGGDAFIGAPLGYIVLVSDGISAYSVVGASYDVYDATFGIALQNPLTLGLNAGTGGSLVLSGSTSGTATINTSPTGVLALPSGTTATSMALTTPVLGAATATSINGTFIGSSANLTRFVSMSNSVSYINLEGNTSGGYIDTSSTVGGPSYSGGYIKTAGGSTSLGGNINTSGSGSNAGGDITTSGGGGSITTNGNGSIGLGTTANRTYLVSTAGNNEKTATFPNVNGTVAVATPSGTTNLALFTTSTSGAPAYRAIASADIATALTTPGAIGGTTASTGAFTTVTLPVNSADYVPTLNLGGNKGLIAETNYVTVVNGSAYIMAFNANGSIVNCDLIANPTNSKSCGTTGGRWSNVFSVLGNFSGAVTCSTTLSVSTTTTMSGRLTANGGITVVGGSYLLTTNSSLTNNSGSSVGTLTNAPDTGNPTKWIAINDNGIERYIPTWIVPPPPP
jgi:hypothetical protein